MGLIRTLEWIASLLLRSLGAALYIVAIIAPLWLIYTLPRESDNSWAVIIDEGIHGFILVVPHVIASIAIATAAGQLYNLGRRLTTRSAEFVMKFDDRPPILFLRSFRSDRGHSKRDFVHLGVAMIPRLQTFEERLLNEFSWNGPVIAVGMPGEKLPPLGAARLYFPYQSTWKTEVKALMQRAQLIIIAAAATDGVIWEVEQAVRLQRPKSLLLRIPSDKDVRREFLSRTKHLWFHATSSWLEVNAKDWALVAFNEAWQPSHYLPESKRRPAKTPIGDVLRAVRRWDGWPQIPAPPRMPGAPLLRISSAFVRVLSNLGVVGAALVLGGMLVYFSSSNLKRLEFPVIRLRVFSDPPVKRLAVSLLPSFGEDMVMALSANQTVRRWIEDPSVQNWRNFGLTVERGISGLRDEDLLAWAAVLRSFVRTVDEQGCAMAMRSIARRSDPDGSKFLKLLPRSTALDSRSLASLIVRSAEAALLGKADLFQGVEFLPGADAAQRSDADHVETDLISLAGSDTYQSLQRLRKIRIQDINDADLCWYQRTWLRVVATADEAIKPKLVRAYFDSSFPPNWRGTMSEPELKIFDEQERKAAQEKLERPRRFTDCLDQLKKWLHSQPKTSRERELERRCLELLPRGGGVASPPDNKAHK